MKNTILIFFLFFMSLNSFSQEEYTINGEIYQLKTEVEGTIDLLWNTIESEFRYFIRSEDGRIQELTNTKGSSGKFQHEYKSLLNNLTNNGLDTSKLNFTLFSLKQFFNKFNSSVDSNYSYSDDKLKINTRLAVFGGITNNPFVDNPDNKTTPQFGAELELYDTKFAKRHAGFLQLTHVLENDDLKYSTTEIALGYRFRFVYADKFNMHANVKFATLNFSKSTITYENESMQTVSKDESATSFDVPLIFGLGADFKISDNGFITLYYNELFALFIDNQGNFSTNFALGYKFNL